MRAGRSPGIGPSRRRRHLPRHHSDLPGAGGGERRWPERSGPGPGRRPHAVARRTRSSRPPCPGPRPRGHQRAATRIGPVEQHSGRRAGSRPFCPTGACQRGRCRTRRAGSADSVCSAPVEHHPGGRAGPTTESRTLRRAASRRSAPRAARRHARPPARGRGRTGRTTDRYSPGVGGDRRPGRCGP